MTLRPDGRTPQDLRDVKITRNWLDHAEGSVLEFYVYLVSALLIPVGVTAFALFERSRWSTVILGVGALAIAIMLARMQVIWTVPVG